MLVPSLEMDQTETDEVLTSVRGVVPDSTVENEEDNGTESGDEDDGCWDVSRKRILKRKPRRVRRFIESLLRGD